MTADICIHTVLTYISGLNEKGHIASFLTFFVSIKALCCLSIHANSEMKLLQQNNKYVSIKGWKFSQILYSANRWRNCSNKFWARILVLSSRHIQEVAANVWHFLGVWLREGQVWHLGNALFPYISGSQNSNCSNFWQDQTPVTCFTNLTSLL